MRRSWKRALTSELTRRGWCHLTGTGLPTMLTIGAFLGRVVAGSASSRVLRPRISDDARPGTFSAAFGYGAQPFHTDAAHWAVPPRYVILHALASSTTGTDVIDLEQTSLKSLRRRMARSAWYVRGGRDAFWASGADLRDGAMLFRFDPMCMQPINPAARSLLVAIGAAPIEKHADTVQWCDLGTLVLDNWRVIHRRRRVNDASMRILARTYVEGQ